MFSIRYTASGRLRLWDSLPGTVSVFLESLRDILVAHSNAVLESEGSDFNETDDPDVACITSVCDKIIMRGNPTLVDVDFEQALISGPARSFFQCTESETDPEIGYRFQKSQLSGNRNELLEAASDLLELPYRINDNFELRPLPLDQKELTSDVEDLFYRKLRASLKPLGLFKIHRQVSIEDLTGENPRKVPAHLRGNLVDFVVNTRRSKWVFEVDGSQHNEPGQSAKDIERDLFLQKAGWTVHRINTSVVRDGFDDWIYKHITQNDQDGGKPVDTSFDRSSVKKIIQTSVMHKAAYYTILVPLAVHRCLRCLTKLYFHDRLDSRSEQRVLVLEEDIPVVAEAMRMLISLWRNVYILSPKIVPPPVVKLDVIGDKALTSRLDPNLVVRNVDSPDGDYDLVLSNSFMLDEGYLGTLERKHSSIFHIDGVRIRNGVGLRTERKLQWTGKTIEYDFPELLRSLYVRNDSTSDKSEVVVKQRSALQFMLRLLFRKRDFRDGQLLAISRLLHRLETVVLLPTGGGKSLVYQMSGMLLPGMTIVIDPLISLMADQVANLRKTGIDQIGEVSSTQQAENRDSVILDMSEGSLAFVFVAPERLQTERFRDSLRTRKGVFPISLAVVDEAHCISEWGHDFRPSYLHLPYNLRNYCSYNEHEAPTVLGLTGTASFAVLADIQAEMDINTEDAIILPSSFDRPQLRFHVESVPRNEKMSALKRYRNQLLPRELRLNPQNFNKLRGSDTNAGLVFCRHVNGDLGVSTVSKELGHDNVYAGQRPNSYIGDWNKHKKSVQSAFTDNRVQELVVTKSFGMGIDKPNIRYTIHYTMPESVEAFYQEAGRAGRNSRKDYARCAILYSDDNWHAALEIFDEPDHEEALEQLQTIRRDNQGDLFTNLWFLLNAYRGPDYEIQQALGLWERHFSEIPKMLPTGSTNTVLVRFSHGKDNEVEKREVIERGIYRLVLLGVIADYTVDWQSGQFKVEVRSVTSSDIKNNLFLYIRKYQVEGKAESVVSEMPMDSVNDALTYAVRALIDFVYTEIVAKRKRAIRTMGEMCREFRNDEEFREAILTYLQESEYSEVLRTWINRSFDDIGLTAINKLLGEVEDLEQIKRLIGTTRRMLDAAPDNIALHYLSVCARLRNDKESEENIVDEAYSLTRHVNQHRSNLVEFHSLLVSLMEEVHEHRNGLVELLVDSILRQYGDSSLARTVLESDKLASIPVVRKHSLVLLAANSLKTLQTIVFYNELTTEYSDA